MKREEGDEDIFDVGLMFNECHGASGRLPGQADFWVKKGEDGVTSEH